MKSNNRIIRVNKNKIVIKGQKDIVRSVISVMIFVGYLVLLIVIKPVEFSHSIIFAYLFVFLFIIYAVYVNVLKRLIINKERIIEKFENSIIINEKNTYEDVRSVYVSYITTVTGSHPKYYVVGFKYYKKSIKSVPLASSSKDDAFDIAGNLASFLEVELIDETENMIN